MIAASTTCVIRARDFSDSTTDPNRDRWTAGKMRHVIAALDGAPVIITTDCLTGFTEVNVTLVGIREGFSHQMEVGIKSMFSDGTTNTIWHLMFKLGDTIVPLAGDNAKWTALCSWRDEKSYAIELAQAEHGDGEGRSWGKWAADPHSHGVHVTYTPSTGNPHFADKWGKRGSWAYSLKQVRRQGRVRAARMHKSYPTRYPAVVVDAEAYPIDLQDAAAGDFTPGS